MQFDLLCRYPNTTPQPPPTPFLPCVWWFKFSFVSMYDACMVPAFVWVFFVPHFYFSESSGLLSPKEFQVVLSSDSKDHCHPPLPPQPPTPLSAAAANPNIEIAATAHG